MADPRGTKDSPSGATTGPVLNTLPPVLNIPPRAEYPGPCGAHVVLGVRVPHGTVGWKGGRGAGAWCHTSSHHLLVHPVAGVNGVQEHGVTLKVFFSWAGWKWEEVGVCHYDHTCYISVNGLLAMCRPLVDRMHTITVP
jgi:hypothetical protein